MEATPTKAQRLLWEDALQDADVDGGEVELFLFDPALRPPGAPLAQTIEPGESSWELCGCVFPFYGPAQARSLRAKAIHEIVAFAPAEPRMLLALLRHELEHVRQHRRNHFELRASTALTGAFEDDFGVASPAFRALYASVATERAANAQATRLSSLRFGAPSSDLRDGPDALLVASQDPLIPDDEVGWRMLAAYCLFPVSASKAAASRFKVVATPAQMIEMFRAELCPEWSHEVSEAAISDQVFVDLRDRLTRETTRPGLTQGSAHLLLGSLIPEAEARFDELRAETSKCDANAS